MTRPEERLIVLDFAEDAAPTVAIAADRVRSVVEISGSRSSTRSPPFPGPGPRAR